MRLQARLGPIVIGRADQLAVFLSVLFVDLAQHARLYGA
jgi:hypothetical protein